MAYCWHCNGVITLFDDDAWFCPACGQHGADPTPVPSFDEAVVQNRPMENPSRGLTFPIMSRQQKNKRNNSLSVS
jgi:hypothetical protein